MNEFPRMMYKAGGNEEMHGGKFSTRIVEDEREQEGALADGWHLTTCEATEAAKPVLVGGSVGVGSNAAVGDNAPPTRDEMEAEAKRRGLNFDGRISDRKLAALLAKA